MPFNNKKNEIETYLKKHNLGVLGVTEANISKENSSFEIEGYKVIPDKGRESSTKMSRTAVIVRSDLTYKVRDDIVNLEIPEVWVEIGEHRKKKP